MGAWLFLGFFIVMGLAVVFVAMRGGPRGARETLQSQSSGGRLGTSLAIGAVIVVFGIALPTLVLIWNVGEQASAGPAGTKLNSAQQEGRKLFATYCATCHTLKDASAVGKVGPDLDILLPKAGLTLNAIEEGRARGQGQMPAELVTGADARNVAQYVARVAGR